MPYFESYFINSLASQGTSSLEHFSKLSTFPIKNATKTVKMTSVNASNFILDNGNDI